MVQDYFMNSENLNYLLKKCKKFAKKHQSFDYLKEIQKIETVNITNPTKAWNCMIYSKVFYLAVGQILNVFNNYITVEA